MPLEGTASPVVLSSRLQGNENAGGPTDREILLYRENKKCSACLFHQRKRARLPHTFARLTIAAQRINKRSSKREDDGTKQQLAPVQKALLKASFLSACARTLKGVIMKLQEDKHQAPIPAFVDVGLSKILCPTSVMYASFILIQNQ